MQARINGHCRVKILIDESGVVKCAVATLGHPLLTKALLVVVKDWRFQPYMVNGRAIAVLGNLDFDFSSANPNYVSLDYDYRPR